MIKWSTYRPKTPAERTCAAMGRWLARNVHIGSSDRAFIRRCWRAFLVRKDFDMRHDPKTRRQRRVTYAAAIAARDQERELCARFRM